MQTTTDKPLTFSQTVAAALDLGLDDVSDIMQEFAITRSMARRVLDALEDDRAYYAATRRAS